jgi:hypothetical protein
MNEASDRPMFAVVKRFQAVTDHLPAHPAWMQSQ